MICRAFSSSMSDVKVVLLTGLHLPTDQIIWDYVYQINCPIKSNHLYIVMNQY